MQRKTILMLRKRKVWTAGLAVLLLLLLESLASAQAPEISADAAIVVDAQDGRTLYEKNADERHYPASMTKIMTCTLALEQNRPARIVEASADAADVECTRLHTGNQLRMQDLLTQMMLISDNGCATAAGESMAQGDIGYFAELMNRKAKAIGMLHTHFVNANGMPDDDHYTTARDMSILMRYALKNPAFRRIIGTRTADISYVRPAGRVEHCVNTNELLGTYAGMEGGKTGWTSAAGGCFTGVAKRNGHELVVVVMHAPDDEARFRDAARLLDYGFSLE